jgi:large subunit ribosomal protein L25
MNLEKKMSEAVVLLAKMRLEFGTGHARALRKNARVPAIIYGAGKKPIAISLLEKDMTKLYRKPSFTSTIINLDIDNVQHRVLAKAVELHPVKDIVRHVDFVFLNDKIQKLEVPIIFENKDKALGVKRGGYFNIVKRTISVLCAIDNIPKNIIIDVTNMPVGKSLKSSDLVLPEGCNLLRKDDFIIASIIGSKGAKAEKDDEAELAQPNKTKAKA